MTRSVVVRADRRSARKVHNRRAIIGAAMELAREKGVGAFSTDELATRAGVSRRTVFNHFASLDDVVTAALTDAIWLIVDDVSARMEASADPAENGPEGQGGGAGLHTALDDIARVLVEADLVQALARIAPLLAAVDPSRPTHATWMQEALLRMRERLLLMIAQRRRDIDPFELDLLASTLLNGLGVAARHWVERTGGAATAASRTVWDSLLATLLERVRHGYRAT